MADADRTSSIREQNAVEEIITLEYMKQCDDSKTTCSITDPLTYQFDLELREPECSTHNKAATYSEYRIKMDMCDDLVHVVETHQFGSQHSCVTVHKEEWNKFILERKDPLTTEWIHTSSNPKPLKAP
jgi:hypothetical protein